jgi:hypothetical protein
MGRYGVHGIVLLSSLPCADFPQIAKGIVDGYADEDCDTFTSSKSKSIIRHSES